MGKAIAIFNQKGGVGKTTTNINLAACLALRGKKVLVLDIDPQGNTTSGLGVAKKGLKDTVYNVLVDVDYDIRDAVIHTGVENLDLIPASVDLAGAEVELVQIEGREDALKKGLDKIKDGYDYIFIDCPPTQSVYTTSAFKASDFYVLVIKPEYLSTIGLSLFLKMVNNYNKNRKTQEKIKCLGIVANLTQKTSDNYHDNKIKDIEEKFKFVCSVFENKIGNISAIAKASEHQRFMNETPGAKRAIKKLANEFLNSYETEVKK